jgi:hypothetical protein
LARWAAFFLLTLLMAGCALAQPIFSRLTSHDRFYGMAFVGYSGPLQPRFMARATVEVPKTVRQPSSPSVQFHVVEGEKSIEGGLWRRRPHSSLTAFTTDVVAGHGVLRILGPVSEGPHVISLRGNSGAIKFFVDGKVAYAFKVRFPMDRSSMVTIGTFVSPAGNYPAGSIWNLSVSANGRDMGFPPCQIQSGGISLEQRGSRWALRGQYDPAQPTVITGCSAPSTESAGAKSVAYPIPFEVQPDWRGVTTRLPNVHFPSVGLIRRRVLGHAVVVVRLVSAGAPPSDVQPDEAAARAAYSSLFKNAKHLPSGDVYVVMMLYSHPSLFGIRDEYAYVFARTSNRWQPRFVSEKELTAIECGLGRCPSF